MLLFYGISGVFLPHLLPRDPPEPQRFENQFETGEPLRITNPKLEHPVKKERGE